MQAQTLTIETNTEKLGNSLFKVTTFEMKRHAICDICGSHEKGTTEELRNRDWFLGEREEFCSDCNH